MNTNKLYIGRINTVVSVNYLFFCGNAKPVNENDIQINSKFTKFTLVKKSKYVYKDIITGEKYREFNISLKEGDKFIDSEYLESFNEKFKNKRKYLTRSSVMNKFNK